MHEVLGVSLDENLRMIADSVAFCAANGRRGRSTTPSISSTASSANPDYALQTLQAAAEAGAAWLVLCDTNGGTLPEEVAEAVDAVAGGDRTSRSASTPTTTATWPSPTPWPPSDAGRRQVQGTINGIGERCGNVDLCSVVANLALKYRGYERPAARQARRT